MQYIQTGENNRERRRVYFHLVDATDGITPEAGEAGGTPTISINGRTPANTVNTLSAVDASKGDYYLELSPSEIVNPAHLLLHYKSANTAHFAQQVQVMAFDPYTWFGTLGGGGGGVDVDYKRIKKLIDEAVGKIPVAEEKEVDMEPIVDGLHAVLEEVRSIRIPEAEKIDFSPITKQLKALQDKIEGINIPETDLSPIESRLNEFSEILAGVADDQGEIKENQMGRIQDFFQSDIERIANSIDELNSRMDAMPYLMLSGQPQKKEKPNILKEYLKQ